VTFRANKKEGASQYYIQGTVDRITAKVDVMETIQWSNGGMTTKNWDLRCKPTKPLF